jgi:phosphoribosylanthranilate isomerase
MKKELFIKVCGMKYPSNRQALEELPVDIFGFIFYLPSPRHVGDLSHEELKRLTHTQKNKTGVFVNTPSYIVLEIARHFGLDHIQLHGHESPGFCRDIKASGLKVIKTFMVYDTFDFSEVTPFAEVSDFFLFDTKARLPGGTGHHFNWQILGNYQQQVPFFLSGGIAPDDAENIRLLSHPALYGIDLNSGFEDAPGLKNYEKLRFFLKKLNYKK